MHWSMVSWWDLWSLLEVRPTGDHSLAVSTNVELCDTMCATVFIAELSCQQHSSQLSVIDGAEIANSFLEDYRQ